MITQAIINLAFTLISFFVSKLPDSAGLPTAFHTAATFLGSTLGLIGSLVDLASMLICLTLANGVILGVFGFKTFKWVVSHIPFVGGRG